MYLAKLVEILFNCYVLLILGRIIGSWFPTFRTHRIMQMIAFYTDPYLNFFRRFIPPIGGVLDLSPMIGLFLLQIAQRYIVSWLL